MLESIVLGLSGVFTIGNILFIVAGLIAGVIFGALPGFSAPMRWNLPRHCCFYRQCIAAVFTAVLFRRFFWESREHLPLRRQLWKEGR